MAASHSIVMSFVEFNQLSVLTRSTLSPNDSGYLDVVFNPGGGRLS